MRPVYRFKLCDFTGKISVTKITVYEEGKWSNTRKYYKYRGTSCVNYFYSDSMDRFKNNQVYSFNPDLEHAREIIRQALEMKANKAHLDYLKYIDKLEKLNDSARNEKANV